MTVFLLKMKLDHESFDPEKEKFPVVPASKNVPVVPASNDPKEENTPVTASTVSANNTPVFNFGGSSNFTINFTVHP